MLKCCDQWQPFWTKAKKLVCQDFSALNIWWVLFEKQQSAVTTKTWPIHWGTVDYIITVHDSTAARCLPRHCCTQIHLHQWLKFISTPMFVAVPLCTRQTTATMRPGTATHTCPNIMTVLKLQCHDTTASSSLFMLNSSGASLLFLCPCCYHLYMRKKTVCA